MELRELRYFVAVARSGGFTKAADALHMAQPALTRQVRKLERELKVQLLVRGPRGVTLTKAGSLLLARSEELFQSVEQTTRDLQSESESAAEHLRISLPPATGVLLAPPLTRNLLKELPGVHLSIFEGVGSSQIDWVFEGRVDVAVVHNPPRLSELAFEHLVTERMVLVLPPAELTTGTEMDNTGKAATLDDLDRLPLILPSRPHTNRTLLDVAMARRGTALRPVMEINGAAITKALVASGLGCTLLTYAAIHSEVEIGTLRFIPIEHPPLLSELVAVHLKVGALTETKRIAVQTIAMSVREAIEDGTWRGTVSRLSADAKVPAVGDEFA